MNIFQIDQIAIIIVSSLLLLLLPFFLIEGAFVLKENKDLSFKVNNNYKVNTTGIYLINLDKAKDRLEQINPLLADVGLPVIRFSAVYGKDLTDEYIDSIVDYDSYEKFLAKEPGKGTIGCYLSHVKTWEEFLKSDYEYAFIFEDDVSFDPRQVKEVYNELLEKKQLWDISSLDINHRGSPVMISKLSNNLNLVIYKYKVTNAGCYIINRTAALQLLKYAYPIKMPIDHYFTRTWELKLKFTGVEPRIVRQTFGDSYINSHEELYNRTVNVKLHRVIYEIKTAVIRYYDALLSLYS